MTTEGLHITERGDGPVVVLLHGLMATGEMFRWLSEPLTSRFRLVIPDLPGHGGSGTVPGPYTVEAMSARVGAALEARGVHDAHVMGYSHGGTVAQHLARDAGHLVRSLALVATYAYNTTTRREQVEGWLAPHMVRLLGMRRFARIVARPGTGGGPPLAPDQVAWLQDMLATNATTQMARAAAELSRFDSRPWLHQLHVPALVVSGGRDLAVPTHHATMLAQAIDAAQTATIAEAGHTMIWTHRDALARILMQWWDGVDRHQTSPPR
ncbi:alpha/beta hydrolase [Actinoplanes sp. NPDC051470]|uniref:alpha/beta fold hydrolase n=1 Tax=Actinoplanes sp. NPDC051470 TaxID=3157224 RepID=UPI003449F168